MTKIVDYLNAVLATERDALALALAGFDKRALRSLKPANRRIVPLGDSMTKGTDYNGIPNENYMWSHIRRLSKGRMAIDAGYVFGTGGIPIPTIVADHLAGALATDAGTLLFLGGTNDSRFGNVTLKNSTDGVDTIVAQARAANKIVILCDGIPWGGLAFGVQSKYVALRDYIRSLHAPEKGVFVVRTWDAIAQWPDAFNIKAGALNPTDDLHPISHGAKLMADAVIRAVMSLFPEYTVHDEPGNLYTTGFVGGGANAAPTVNGVACTVTIGATAAAAGAAYTVVDDNGDRWIKVTIPAHTADATTPLNIDLPNIAPATLGILPGTDKVDYAVKFRMFGTGFRALSQTVLYTGGTAIVDLLDMQGPASTVTTYGLTTDYIEGVLNPWPKLLPAGAAKCQPRLALSAINGAQLKGEFWIAAPRLIKR